MKNLWQCCRIFAFHVVVFNLFLTSNAYILAPKKSPTNSPKDYQELLMLVGQDELHEQPPSEEGMEDLVLQKILSNISELKNTKTSEEIPQLEKPKSFGQDALMDPGYEAMRDRRQAMGIYNDQYFSFKDKLATEQLKTKLFGPAPVSKSTCLSTLLRVGIKSVEELMRAEEFCS